MLNIFYAEPDPDRWLPFDRYPRRVIRRILRGPSPILGHRRVFLNLCAGLDRIGVAYQVNNFDDAKRHPDQVTCIVGKPFLLEERAWRNPIVFGAAVYSHPSDAPALLARFDIRKILVPCEWMRRMCEPAWGGKVVAWPVGIDTDRWSPPHGGRRDIDVLVYDKIRWQREQFEPQLLDPVIAHLRAKGLSIATLRYGVYREEDYFALLQRSRSMVFLCEHETQGIAYQQALSSGVPVIAWDRGGEWRDPAYHPDRVRFGPVSSVPYWDERCGSKFAQLSEFVGGFDVFWERVATGAFQPRDYVLENLTLEACARRYVEIVEPAA